MNNKTVSNINEITCLRTMIQLGFECSAETFVKAFARHEVLDRYYDPIDLTSVCKNYQMATSNSLKQFCLNVVLFGHCVVNSLTEILEAIYGPLDARIFAPYVRSKSDVAVIRASPRFHFNDFLCLLPALQNQIRNKKIIILIGLKNEALVLQQLGLLESIEKIYSFNLKTLVRMEESRLVHLCPNLKFYFRSTNNNHKLPQSIHYATRDNLDCAENIFEMQDILVNRCGFPMLTLPSGDIDLRTNFIHRPFPDFNHRYELDNTTTENLTFSFDLSNSNYKEEDIWLYKASGVKYLPFSF